MTCIVAIKKGKNVYMGGDSAGTSGGTITIRDDKKVFIKGKGDKKMIFGFCGSYRVGQILQYSFKVPVQKIKNDHAYMCTSFISELQNVLQSKNYTSKKDDPGGPFIVGYKGIIYLIDYDYQVGIPSFDYYAMGSGKGFAKGSLYTTKDMKLKPEERITLALESSASQSTTVEGPFTLKKI